MTSTLISRVGTAMGAGLLLLGALAFAVGGDDQQTVSFLFPNAANLIAGADVEVDGVDAGSIRDVQLRDGRAEVVVELHDDVDPLTAGTTAFIEYRALLGERIVQVVPGDPGAEPLPDGAVVDGNIPRVELDAVLNALTPEVREDLQGFLQRTAAALDGREDDLNETLQQAGPAVDELGAVLAAVGRDGEALQRLVEQAAELTSHVVDERADVAELIDGLDASFGALASRDAELEATLDELPTTLDQVGDTLEDLDPTVDEVLPVVQDLRPVTERLPGVSQRLAPVLTDLRPTVAELRELLPRADRLLQVTPGLLDDTATTLPEVDRALQQALPTVDTLRPYTPEVIGWMTNWAGLWKYYDSHGRFARIWANEGTGSFLETPTEAPGAPGLSNQGNRPPGDLVGQPWTDATGSQMR